MKKAFLLAFSLVFVAGLFGQKSWTVGISSSSGWSKLVSQKRKYDWLSPFLDSYRVLSNFRFGGFTSFQFSKNTRATTSFRIQKLLMLHQKTFETSSLLGCIDCFSVDPDGHFTSEIDLIELPFGIEFTQNDRRFGPFFSVSAVVGSLWRRETISKPISFRRVVESKEISKDENLNLGSEAVIGARLRFEKIEFSVSGRSQFMRLQQIDLTAHEIFIDTSLGYRF